MLVVRFSPPSLIAPPFGPIHVSGAQNQGRVPWLQNEKHDQVPAAVGLPQGRVEILTAAESPLDKSVRRIVEEDFLGFFLGHTMLACQLVEDVGQPEKGVD